MENNVKVLLVEDDRNMSFIIKSSLEEIIMGYTVTSVQNGAEALSVMNDNVFDIIVSDIEMPVMNGIELALEIRKILNDIPLLLITGKTSAKDVVEGYGAGADMYIKKPFLPDELDAHIKALLRMKKASPRQQDTIKIGKYIFDYTKRNLILGLNRIHLTSKEADVLNYLAKSQGEIVSRTEILSEIWGHDDYYTSRSLDVFLARLRKLLSEDQNVEIIVSKGVGISIVDHGIHGESQC